ncbi:MAG: hypothetical protein MJ067_02835 [Oscillospiraceae bacterium]|nr:hypothetical protein [Oscillospiraceae bacterium]
MFGIGKKHDLLHAVFAREGSAFYVIENYYTHKLCLGSYKPEAWIDANPFLFSLHLYKGETELLYSYTCNDESLKLITELGQAEIILTDKEYARIISENGLTIGFEADTYKPGPNFAPIYCSGCCLFPSGEAELSYGSFGRLRFVPVSGKVETNIKSDGEGKTERLLIKLCPPEDGCLDAALHEAVGDYEDFPESYPSPAELKELSKAAFTEFKRNYAPPAKGYEELFEYAAHTAWARRTKPGAGGSFKSPMILMHYEYLGAAFSWQQAIHGMSMLACPDEAFRMICNMFEYQDERTGQLPGKVAFSGPNCALQPPTQGFALDFLISRVGDGFLSPERCEEMFPKFALWAEFWAKYRSSGRGDVPAIDSPNDSGWDDATVFRRGFPTENPDLIAFIILLLEKTGLLAEKCGKMAEAEHYYERSRRLLSVLIDEYWNGENFVCKRHGEAVPSLSVVTYQPIILGKRLPGEIIDKICEKLMEEGSFLTDIGLASESLKSTDSAWGTRTFVHGRVVAPLQAYFCAGLNMAGKKKEAAEIARRFAARANERGIILGYPPRYDYYPATGKPVYIAPGPVASDGWPWSGWAAAAIMILITAIIPDGEKE